MQKNKGSWEEPREKGGKERERGGRVGKRKRKKMENGKKVLAA